MREELHVYIHTDHLDRKLDEILRLLRVDIMEGRQMATDFEQAFIELTAKVQNTTDAEDSVLVLVKSMAEQIKNAAGDPAAVRALSAKLTAGADALAAAVVANTAAADPATPPAP